MFGQRRNSGARAASAEVERRLRSLEKSVARAGSHVASRTAGTTDHMTEALNSAVNALAERFRGVSIGDEAARFGGDAAKLGNDALRRLAKEVEHRPLVTVGVAVGIGILAGLVILRR